MSRSISATAQMNRIYRRQRHVYDLTRKYYLLGRDDLIERLRPAASHGVLEIGCGTGRNLIVAADRYPAARFYGIDVSTDMLTTALDNIASAGLVSRILLAHADATTLVPLTLFGRKNFERIFLSYTLSMMPRWQATLDIAISTLAPAGELHIVDFGSQEGLPTYCRTALRWWLQQFGVIPCDRLEFELRLRAKAARAALEIRRPYRGYAQYAVFRRN